MLLFIIGIIMLFLIIYLQKKNQEDKINKAIQKIVDKKGVSLQYTLGYKDKKIKCTYIENNIIKSFVLCEKVDLNELYKRLPHGRFRIKDVGYFTTIVETKEYILKNSSHPIRVVDLSSYDMNTNNFKQYLKDISPKEEKQNEYEKFVIEESISLFRMFAEQFEQQARNLIYQNSKQICTELILDSREYVYVSLVNVKRGTGYLRSYKEERCVWQLEISQLYRDIVMESRKICKKEGICINDKIKVKFKKSYGEYREEYYPVLNTVINGNWNEKIEVAIIIEASIVY